MKPFSAPLPEALAGERLDRVVAMLCDLPRSVAAELVDAREVRVDGEVQTRRSRRVVVGEVISLDVPEPPPEATVRADANVQFDVVHEDEHLLVIDKPAGLVVHPGSGNAEGTLVHGLLARYPEIATVGDAQRPGIVHRLDRDTSGLLVVARTAEAFDALSAAMRSRTVTRRYHTLVWGHLDEPRGMVDAPIARSPREPTRMAVVVGGRQARTRYEVVARYDQPAPVSELVCLLETGRTHQIRVHLQAIGHSVVGDTRYGGARQAVRAPRQFLHAEHLAFAHPVTDVAVAVDSALPPDLLDVLAALS